MPSVTDLVIAPEPIGSAAVQFCLDEYYRELRGRFDEGFDPELSNAPRLDEFAPPQGIFLIARLTGEPVGCGGLKPRSPQTAYLKRMWIARRVRGLGLAKQLLFELERQALVIGYSTICLETHHSLVEAQQLYRSAGYLEVPPFNDERYADHWFEKALGSPN